MPKQGFPSFPCMLGCRASLRARSPVPAIQISAWGLARASYFPANAREGLEDKLLTQRNIRKFLVLVVGLPDGPSKEVHILISETYECYLIWQEGFADMLQLRILRWRDDLDDSDVLSMPLIKGRLESQSHRRRPGDAGSRGWKIQREDGGRSHQPRNAGSH